MEPAPHSLNSGTKTGCEDGAALWQNKNNAKTEHGRRPARTRECSQHDVQSRKHVRGPANAACDLARIEIETTRTCEKERCRARASLAGKGRGRRKAGREEGGRERQRGRDLEDDVVTVQDCLAIPEHPCLSRPPDNQRSDNSHHRLVNLSVRGNLSVPGSAGASSEIRAQRRMLPGSHRSTGGYTAVVCTRRRTPTCVAVLGTGTNLVACSNTPHLTRRPSLRFSVFKKKF